MWLILLRSMRQTRQGIDHFNKVYLEFLQLFYEDACQIMQHSLKVCFDLTGQMGIFALAIFFQLNLDTVRLR